MKKLHNKTIILSLLLSLFYTHATIGMEKKELDDAKLMNVFNLIKKNVFTIKQAALDLQKYKNITQFSQEKIDIMNKALQAIQANEMYIQKLKNCEHKVKYSDDLGSTFKEALEREIKSEKINLLNDFITKYIHLYKTDKAPDNIYNLFKNTDSYSVNDIKNILNKEKGDLITNRIVENFKLVNNNINNESFPSLRLLYFNKGLLEENKQLLSSIKRKDENFIYQLFNDSNENLIKRHFKMIKNNNNSTK